MKKPLRSTAGVLAAVLVSGLLATQALTSADAAAPVTIDPPVDCRQKAPKPPSPTPSPTGTPSPTPSPTTPPPAPTPAPAPPDTFTPADGALTWNNPLGNNAAKRQISDRIVRAINSTPTCSTIQIATWNFRSAQAADALVAAVKRGVTVRVFIASGNDGAKGTDTYNPVWKDLRARLDASNVEKGAPRNWARLCYRACRYKDGAAHSKYYLFSRVGKATNVVMYGSHNVTSAAVVGQWNDLYTVDRDAIYTKLQSVFSQSMPENNLSSPYTNATSGDVKMNVYPFIRNGRPAAGDPLMAALNRVKCTSAGSVGISGRTALRINVSAMLGQRGQDLAAKLVRLRRAGCNIKVLVTNVGYHAMKAMQRGGVQLRQLTKYDSRTRKYVMYTHFKMMAISGNYGGRSNQQIAFNGSANWTGPALVSDELVGEVRRPAAVNSYNHFVNTWYTRTPMGSKVVPTTTAVDGRADNPWSLVEQDF
ncbi:phospholipase D-like domain-containing protein [Nocardioides aurantiacus]|uniref:phospholipase D n=1 Tax=Nocardioides aurantiacus TaxID=86796 RepID=A0A3N2CYZ6_9ACTN|nr:phospholipase D-like domain-containing protein [Nocardioides aurantiacus]ROR92414.1 phosphatidylserine/phosphatidylglycerophosphate/cardiolipin synthase-like enzyme [Nocardioides aurantiacus]